MMRIRKKNPEIVSSKPWLSDQLASMQSGNPSTTVRSKAQITPNSNAPSPDPGPQEANPCTSQLLSTGGALGSNHVQLIPWIRFAESPLNLRLAEHVLKECHVTWAVTVAP